jgi:predicted dehydrogenase
LLLESIVSLHQVSMHERSGLMSRGTDRRDFLKKTALAGVGYWVAERSALASTSPNERLNIACIGVGGKGSSDADQAANHGNIVALCDVDDNPLNGKSEKFSQAKKFNDYRKMLQEMDKQIDAVTVSTADHSHAPASLMAMKMGKHVYCQKPLTHTVQEARMMRETAQKQRVATQMGNQGTAENGLRRAVEIIQAGVLGQVKEVHVWTNRPIWPQGADGILKCGAARTAALGALRGKMVEFKPATPPNHVHWDLFLGPAPERPYDPCYHPFAWRGWWDFGTGALGDMACHTANMAFMALRLGYPTSVTAEAVDDLNPETCPTGARVVFQFPEREGMAPVKFIWYEGIDRNRKRYLPQPDLFHGQSVADSGSLLVGDKAILYSPNDYGAAYVYLGKDAKDVEEAAKKVPETLPRNGKSDDGMKAEWVQAIKEGKPSIAMSNFNYAGMLTETILLGNVAMRFPGKSLDWDGPNLKITNIADANQFLHYEYRKGWEV